MKPKGQAVEWEQVAKRTIHETVSASGKVFPETEVKISSDVSGEIVELFIKEGDTVIEGDSLCVLEAMKMENALGAPRDGVVKAVHIATGETVDKNALLIELED